MGDVLSWIGAAGGAAGVLALFVSLRESRGRRYTPDPELRGLLEALVEDFNEIVSSGGRPAPWFTEALRRGREVKLSSLHGAVVDDELNSRIAAARGEYLDCFSYSSPSRPANQVDHQIEAATAGRASATGSIDRLNTLMRKFGHL